MKDKHDGASAVHMSDLEKRVAGFAGQDPARYQEILARSTGMDSGFKERRNVPLAERLSAVEKIVGHPISFIPQGPFIENTDGFSTRWEGGYVFSAIKDFVFAEKIKPEILVDALKSALRAAGVTDAHVYRTSKGILVGAGDLEKVFNTPNPPEGGELSESQAFAEVHQAGDAFAQALKSGIDRGLSQKRGR